MKLEKLTNSIFYYPHQPEFDRPMLGYLKGSKFSMAVDAGYSQNHVKDFYTALIKNGLKKPNFTVITHWHYDHTFGMNNIHGVSIAHYKTNEFLKKQQKKATDLKYIEILKKEDIHFAKEYQNQKELNIVLSDIEFHKKIIFHLGNLSAVVFHTESPHSEDTVCIYIPEEKVLFLGDATSEDFFNNSYMDKSKLKKLVHVIENIDCIYCVLSHAEPLRKKELLDYLYNALEN